MLVDKTRLMAQGTEQEEDNRSIAQYYLNMLTPYPGSERTTGWL